MQPVWSLTSASTYYQTKCGKRRHQWVKLSAIVLCGSLLPLSISLDWGPSSDLCQVPALISKARQAAKPAKLYADRGYDAESTHELIRREWGSGKRHSPEPASFPVPSEPAIGGHR